MKGSRTDSTSASASGTEDEVIYLDVNEVSKTLPNPKQCVVNQVEASPDGSKVAYAVDGTGYETYDIVVKYLDGSKPDETVKKTMGGVAWRDETTFYYVVEDKSHRPYQVGATSWVKPKIKMNSSMRSSTTSTTSRAGGP